MGSITTDAFTTASTEEVASVLRATPPPPPPPPQKIETLNTDGVFYLLRKLCFDTIPFVPKFVLIANGRLANYSEDLSKF